jgi:hypothetical protein
MASYDIEILVDLEVEIKNYLTNLISGNVSGSDNILTIKDKYVQKLREDMLNRKYPKPTAKRVSKSIIEMLTENVINSIQNEGQRCM